MGDETPYQRPSRTYTVALTASVLLFLATLTVVVVVILIANAREDEREDEFELTLTGVYHAGLEARDIQTPTAAPAVTSGAYAFAPAADPAYQAAPSCDRQMLVGQIVDQDGQPVDGFDVWVWGDYTAPQVAQTGPLAQRARGEWVVTLPGMVNRRVWVQVQGGERYLSAPVEVVFAGAGCDRNRADITFAQVAPLN